MINYFELGGDKRLHEIVVAGSHDAGIYNQGLGGNVRTQKMSIGGQARAGVRMFDLRVAAASGPHIPFEGKSVELKTFHADPKLMSNKEKSRYLIDAQQAGEVTRTNLRGGGFGQGLAELLQEAEDFVTSKEGSTEFLILKFDKSYNWNLIGATIVDVLRKSLYKGGANLNSTKLNDLAGKVIVLCTAEGIAEMNLGPFKETEFKFILPWKNLKSDGGGYDPHFQGLQYYGKGGTSPFKPFDKIKQNEKKQAKLMRGAKSLQSPEVLGMMYWTTTGLSESIRVRNKTMWTPQGVDRLKTLWNQGLGEYMDESVPLDVPDHSPAIGSLRKRFMPNIIMIDFASDRKCGIIRALNDTPESQFVDLEENTSETAPKLGSGTPRRKRWPF
jgi:hypothetical protein